MKKSLIILSLLAAVGAHAQVDVTSQAGSASQAGASSGASAIGSVINFGSAPETQTVNENVNVKYDTRAEQILNGHTVEDNNIHYSGTQKIKNVPAIAMSGPASGPCTGVSGGIGIAGPGWGFGANGSSVMDDCRMRENVRVIGMAMQSLDGTANPQEKGEATVLFMDALRGLAAYNAQIVGDNLKKK